MSYPRQDSVNKRLHLESLTALEAIGERGLNKLGGIWRSHRKEMQLAIMNAYRRAAPSGRWDLATYKGMAHQALQSELRGILERFRAASTVAMKSYLNDIYKNSFLRYAWILDQLTPESRDVWIPNRKFLHEAAVSTVYFGKKAAQMWDQKWSMWVESYNSSLQHNLALGASNNSAISDAVAEVDATTTNSPASSLWNALSRMYEYEGTYAIAAGEQTIGDINDELVDVEIWKTRGDLNVCEDCDANEGLPMDEVDDDIPMHPNCHCYPLLVPKSYSKLLQSGDEADQLLARDMMDDGIVPNALVIRNQDGEIAAKTIVGFNQWVKGQGMAVLAQ